MEIVKSKVYVQTDKRSRIIRCEGGYTTPADLSGWMEIDEGVGDRFNLAQSHYFPGGLYIRTAFLSTSSKTTARQRIGRRTRSRPTAQPSCRLGRPPVRPI